MTKSPPRLGKGLSALLGTQNAAYTQHAQPGVAELVVGDKPQSSIIVRDILLDNICPNPNQPRSSIDRASLKQLAESIRQSGVLQPILVRAIAKDAYELVAGERRWQAAKLADRRTIPAIVRELNEIESFELALIENLQREDLGPIERASAYQQLIDTLDIHIDDLAARLGESRANVANYLRLLKLEEPVQQMICSGELGMGHARALVGLIHPQRQLALAKLAIRRNLSVRQVEALARQTSNKPDAPERGTHTANPHLDDVQQSLSKALGLQIVLHPGKKKNSGRIVIRYNSLEEFDRIAERIGGKSALE